MSAHSIAANFEALTKRIRLDKTEFGYNRTTYMGTCSEDVTPADIKARFCDSYFGGSAHVQDGKFTCVAFGND